MSDDGDDVVENLAAALGYEAERADHEKIIDLADRRPPVVYSVTITEGWDGYLAVEVHHVQDDPRSRFAVADALSRASMLIKEKCQDQ